MITTVRVRTKGEGESEDEGEGRRVSRMGRMLSAKLLVLRMYRRPHRHVPMSRWTWLMLQTGTC